VYNRRARRIYSRPRRSGSDRFTAQRDARTVAQPFRPRSCRACRKCWRSKPRRCSASHLGAGPSVIALTRAGYAMRRRADCRLFAKHRRSASRVLDLAHSHAPGIVREGRAASARARAFLNELAQRRIPPRGMCSVADFSFTLSFSSGEADVAENDQMRAEPGRFGERARTPTPMEESSVAGARVAHVAGRVCTAIGGP